MPSLKLSRTQALPVGVDVGADSIKAMQLAVAGDGLRVVCAAREPTPPLPVGDPIGRAVATAQVLGGLLRQNDFSGRRVVLALPREMVHIKNLRLPPMPAEEVARAVSFEARTLFPFDIDQATVRHILAGEVRQGHDVRQELIVLAARESDVEPFVEAVHAAGLVLESIDYEPCAVYRCVERFLRRKEDELDVHVLVDVGLRRSQVIIGRGRDVSLVKPIEIGGQHLRDAVARKLGITAEEAVGLRRRLAEEDRTAEAVAGDAARPAVSREPVRDAVYDVTRGILEDLAREIALCLRYYSVTFRGARPTRVRVVGGEASDPQLLRILNNNLPIPVEAGRPLGNVDTVGLRPALRRGGLSEWAVATGLSLKGTDRHFAGYEGRARGAGSPPDETQGGTPADVAAAPSAGRRAVGGLRIAEAARSDLPGRLFPGVAHA